MNCKFWAQQTPRVAGQEGRVCSLTFLNHTNLKEEEKKSIIPAETPYLSYT